MKELSDGHVKQILVPNKNPHRFFGIDFFASLYQGSNPIFQYFGTPMDSFQVFDSSTITPKQNGIEVFTLEIRSKIPGMVIGFYQNPDPYHALEEEFHLMSKALEILSKQEIGVYIETTNDLILRDLPILQKINEKAPVVVVIPFGQINDLILHKIEPNSPTFSQRLKLLHKLSSSGITTGILLKPIIPFINDSDENITTIIEKGRDAGASFIYPSFGISLEKNQRKDFYNLIDHEFPGLKNVCMDVFGSKKIWISTNASQLKKTFVFECKKKRMFYGMKDIVELIKPSSTVQIKLF
ncbi:MAG: hypothetical protein KJ971_00290 [Firmicutes bacterium]|nr:hypothetical protein [Bacillota bacterium]